MMRKIINIDEDRCNGCGICVDVCHEGALEMRNGKAYLTRDDYCDGLGDCLPACPQDAIKMIEREAAEFSLKEECGCPGMAAQTLKSGGKNAEKGENNKVRSCLAQWPVQIKLAPVKAAHYENAELLLAADCAAYVCGNFHTEYMDGKITLIGCPKLDNTDYSEKLREILANNNIKSVTAAIMEVPCCGGLEAAATKAVRECGRKVELKVEVLKIREE